MFERALNVLHWRSFHLSDENWCLRWRLTREASHTCPCRDPSTGCCVTDCKSICEPSPL